MASLKESYTSYYDVKKDGRKEVQKALRTGDLNHAFETLKKVLYDYGYQLSGKEVPKVEYNQELADRVGEVGFRSDALINTLIEMDNSYRAEKMGIDLEVPSIPSSLGLEKKEYVEKTEEELLKEAESVLLPGLIKDKTEAKEKLEKTGLTLNRKEEDLDSDFIESGQELLYAHQKDKEDHLNDMIFSGLYHSSIRADGEQKIDEKLNLDSLKLKAEYDVKYERIKADLALAEKEYENAIKTFDLEYAADLQEKLNKLKLSEEKRKEEINAYNKKIAEQEEKYKVERLETLAKLRSERQEALFAEMEREQEMESKYGVSPEKAEEYARRRTLATNFYQNFTREEALVLMLDAQEELVNLLGKKEYAELINWNVAR